MENPDQVQAIAQLVGGLGTICGIALAVWLSSAWGKHTWFRQFRNMDGSTARTLAKLIFLDRIRAAGQVSRDRLAALNALVGADIRVQRRGLFRWTFTLWNKERNLSKGFIGEEKLRKKVVQRLSPADQTAIDQMVKRLEEVSHLPEPASVDRELDATWRGRLSQQ